MAPAEDVAVKMGHGFATIPTVVDHQPVAPFFQPDFLGDLRRFEQQMAEQSLVAAFGFRDAGDRPLRHQQHMFGRLRSNVTKGQHQVIFVNNLRRDLPFDDFFKKSHRNCALESATAQLRYHTTNPQPSLAFSAVKHVRR